MVDHAKLNTQKQVENSSSFEIGTLMASYREKAGMSADELARLVGVDSGDTLLKYEAGQTEIPLDVIFAVSNELAIPPEEIINLVQDCYLKSF